ncbi:MAG: hypothetical protein IKL03_05025, partial [Bacteroidaceae bacterium]|nr:hypothetical protein [Bacteroidaceae bacterium]
QSYDAANGVCSEFDMLREEKQQAIFFNPPVDDNASWFPIHATKVMHQKSDVNKIISLCKSLQECILFYNFAQRNAIV